MRQLVLVGIAVVIAACLGLYLCSRVQREGADTVTEPCAVCASAKDQEQFLECCHIKYGAKSPFCDPTNNNGWSYSKCQGTTPLGS